MKFTGGLSLGLIRANRKLKGALTPNNVQKFTPSSVQSDRNFSVRQRDSCCKIDAHPKEPPMAPFTAFLSHSTKDGEFVKKLAEELKHQGIDPWLCEMDIIP